MKKSVIIKLLILCGVALLYCSCKPNCDIDKPKGVKPIDWENYNDVYIVYWNCKRECSDVWTHNNAGKDIKVSGWIFQGFEGGYPPVNPANFALIDNEANIFGLNSSVGLAIYVTAGNGCSHIDYEDYINLVESLKVKFAEADIAKKCYISGKLWFAKYPDNACCTTGATISICSADDIYFE